MHSAQKTRTFGCVGSIDMKRLQCYIKGQELNALFEISNIFRNK